MDDTTKPSPDGPADDAADSNSAEEDDPNNNVALGIVFASVGFTLVMTLDTPWAGLARRCSCSGSISSARASWTSERSAAALTRPVRSETLACSSRT